MSAVIILLGIVGILTVVTAGIIDVYYGSKARSDKTKRNTLYAASILCAITVIIIIILMVLGHMGSGGGSGSSISQAVGLAALA